MSHNEGGTVQSAYEDFLQTKKVTARQHGLSSVPDLAGHLFEYQKHCVDFALRAGSSGLFLDTGLGKTRCELEFSHHAMRAANGRALILAPLAVAWQIAAEGECCGYDVRVIRDQSEARAGINVCNYDRLEKLDVGWYGSVALDESSIIKSFTGKTTRELISEFSGYRWRLAATATPAPNDHMELGQHSQFLGIMESSEMLARWFISDQTEMGRYRLKGHARESFYDWMASWSRMGERPSDLGDTTTAYDLPNLSIVRHRCEAVITPESGSLFGALNVSATDMFDVKRKTSRERAGIVGDLVNGSKEPWVIWCDTNDEADHAMAAIGSDAIEVRGSQSIEEKEDALRLFASGGKRAIVTKPSICGHGLNWQHCRLMAFMGRTFSYEAYYQAVRRCWRYGQKRDVVAHVVVADGEESIGRVLDRKGADHAAMKAEMVAAMSRNMAKERGVMLHYNPKHEGRLPTWFAV